MGLIIDPTPNQGWGNALENIDSEREITESIKISKTLYIWPPQKKKDRHRGPNPKQKQIWFEKSKPHKHKTDVLLLIGASRSGKSQGAVARCLYTAKKYPGAKIIVGSINFNHLEITTMEDYKKLLSINDDWDHPFIKRKPGKYRKRIEFVNGSVIYFVNLEQFLKTLGMGIDMLHVEEAQLLGDENMLDILITRMSNDAVPFKQIVMTANPMDDLRWLETRFDLAQFDPETPGYTGEQWRPIGKPCDCQICPRCKALDDLDIEWIADKCPNCKDNKETDCPGREYHHRVIPCDASDNFDNLPPGYQSDLRALMSAHKYQQFGKGTIKKAGKGLCYESFSMKNVRSVAVEIDYLKDIVWSHDFNNHPMCSAIAQVGEDISGKPSIYVLDEIIGWGASAAKVAMKFVDKYSYILANGFQGKILLYGDPSAHTRANMMSNRYFQMKKILEKAGFEVDIKVRHTVYPVDDRIETMNYFLCEGQGIRRLFFNAEKCPHLIVSAEKIDWAPNGKDENKNWDRRAAASKQYHLVHAMTHPMAALGYFLVEEYPVVDKKKTNAFFMNPITNKIVELIDGVLHERKGDDENEEKDENLDIESYEYDQNELNDWEATLPTQSTSLASTLRSQRSWNLPTPDS